MREQHSKNMNKRRYYDLNVEDERSQNYYSNSDTGKYNYF
jgi:hypothetical protein